METMHEPSKISAEFCDALAAAQAEMGHAQKDREVDIDTKRGGKIRFAYATLASCLDVVRPPWSKHGISYTFDVDQELREVDYEADSGQVMKRLGTMVKVAITLYFKGELRTFSPTVFSVPSLEPRAIGSAITYGKRYQLTNASGIAGEDDDDADGAQPPVRPPPPRGVPTKARASEPDPAVLALGAEFGRRIKTATLEEQVVLRVQIRESEVPTKGTLIEDSINGRGTKALGH